MPGRWSLVLTAMLGVVSISCAPDAPDTDTRAPSDDETTVQEPTADEPDEPFEGFALLARMPEVLAAHRDEVPKRLPTLRDVESRARRRLDSQEAGVVAAARAVAKPYPSDLEHAHEVVDAMLARWSEAVPDIRIARGDHPHPRALPPLTGHLRAVGAIALIDARAWLAEHPPDAAATVHERSDRLALQHFAAHELNRAGRDGELLSDAAALVRSLWMLAVIDCCAEEDRVAALTSCLQAVPARVEASVGSIGQRARSSSLGVAATLRSDAGRLRRVHEVFRDRNSDLGVAATGAAAALDEAAQALETRVTDGRGDFEDGDDLRAYYGAWLRRQAGADLSPRDYFDAAIEQARSSIAEIREITSAELPGVSKFERVHTPAERLDVLAEAAPEWAGELPGDPGVKFHPVRESGPTWGALLYAPGPRSGATPSAFVGTWPDASNSGAAARWENLSRLHLVAHETYPGHHLQSWLARDACELRRVLPSRFTVEGWASYAEDLIHETGHCPADEFDNYQRAYSRCLQALGAALEILIGTTPTSIGELAKELDCGSAQDFVAGMHARARIGASTPYFVGRLEIERLRRIAERIEGDAFDLKSFHRRLLAVGPLAPRLLEKELFPDGGAELGAPARDGPATGRDAAPAPPK